MDGANADVAVATHTHARMPKPELMKPAETRDDQVKEEKPAPREW